jgi:hypothetical protein
MPSRESRAKDRECWHCGKKGHFKADCRRRLTEPKESKKEESRDVPCSYGVFSNKRSGWIGDSGAYTHITGRREWFSDLTPIKTETLTTASGHQIKTSLKGTIDIEASDGISWKPETLNEVRYVPNFGDANLFSTGQLASKGFKIIQEGEKMELEWNEKTVITGVKKGNIHEMAIRVKKGTTNTICLSEKEENPKEAALRWHLRLGHISKEKMKTLVKNKAVTGLPPTEIPDFTCEGCILGRMSRKPYGTPSIRETVPGAAIPSDICGPFSVQSIGRSSYFITFKDEATAFRTIYFLRHKSEALQAFKKFLTDFTQTK